MRRNDEPARRLTAPDLTMGNGADGATSVADDPITRHNVLVESFFSAFNGVYMALAILAAPVVAVTAVNANPLELTILVSAFPVGVFFGPLWADLGRRWGMQKLVTQMAVWANVPLFFLFWIEDAAWFTALVTVSQLLNSAMRMGQSSLYRVMYVKAIRGRVLGVLTFWTYVTMVPSILAAGWLLDKSPQMYRILYPLAGLCGLIGCFYYGQLHVPAADQLPRTRRRLRDSLHGVERIVADDRAYLFFQVAFFLSGSAFFMSTHVVLLLTRDRFHFGAFELALWMSVVPQLLLALSSPVWGRVLDRIGIVRLRLVISTLMTAYLASYFFGIVTGAAVLIYLGSVLQGISNGAGQLTWALASSHFAPRSEDVPVYNGIHFVLNGVRGLLLPWIGSVLFILVGPWAVLAATLVSLGSVPIVLRSLSFGDGPELVEGSRE
jgi:MFS family permease